MFLMYVDESGDPGLAGSPCRYYVLSGLVVHELRWRSVLERLLAFRRRMRDAYGLKLREELHAARMINKPGDLVRIKRHDRLAIIREFADQLASIPDVNVINVVIDKQGKDASYDVFESAWRILIQRLEDTIAHRNFRGPRLIGDRALIFPDDTDNKRLRTLLRRMRFENPIPSRCGTGVRNLPMAHVIEDPVLRDSEHSYLIQAADLVAFLLYQELAPNGYMRKKGGHNYFARLSPVLCTVASRRDPRGIVRL
jgi:hypothetical protein